MKLKEPISNLLEQLQYVLDGLTNDQYAQPVKILSGSTIGQHTRHILEFFIELNQGYISGIVNYDKRMRNRMIETDKDFAVQILFEIEAGLDKPNRELLLQVEYDDQDAEPVPVFTNYLRELVYNLEHMVHHMALIRIGVNTVADLEIPEGFGVAASTLKFRKACAQ
ncbi:hypothetical protein [Mucilaginibacter gotjawali]|uniref:Alpha-amylase/alpha-mannosidase (GH57 family) n=1 Tax=Mucilaginibacter gotjawali TaxID=1550579 RepID=A0A839S920_9SPHI|nr:hypothetical protein [Mucilaginibacter gotjawali]MBB3054316.1 alpha-amylase/alpha-mannosidase (GH57 family) [Mucilaginibacter gotjawali]